MSKIKRQMILNKISATYHNQNPVSLICKQCLQTNMEKTIHPLEKLAKHVHLQLRERENPKLEIHKPGSPLTAYQEN